MSSEEVAKLSSRGAVDGKEIHFMDVTDFIEPKINKYFVEFPKVLKNKEVVFSFIEELSEERLREVVTHLSSYTTRYYTSATGVQASNWLVSEYQRFAGSRTDIEVLQFVHSWPQPSVIARIIGNGPHKDEVVVVGGHIDSTSSGARAPGADDDASGSSTVLEIFRVLAEDPNWKPDRTIEFHGYAAEEVGLRGSQAIANNYASIGINVVAMLQLDMTGYVRPGTIPTIGIVTDFTDTTLTAFLRQLVTTYCTTRWQNTACGYGCSDHASWYRSGYPASFSFEGLFSNSNPYIHSVNDLASNLNFAHGLEFAKLGLGFVVELANP